jgi:hypothetical protein
VPAVAPNPYSDPTFLEQIVKVVAAGMAKVSGSAPRQARVVTLVHWVKGMREMGCVTFSREEDAEVAVHWLMRLTQILVSGGGESCT